LVKGESQLLQGLQGMQGFYNV